MFASLPAPTRLAGEASQVRSSLRECCSITQRFETTASGRLRCSTDSKQISPEGRAELLDGVLRSATKISIQVIPPDVIDRDGLHRSNLRGLRDALLGLTPPAEICLVDGFRLGPTAPEHQAIVDGDERSAVIAAASIVAKVMRDRAMHRMDALFPGYGFASHVGYITPGHSDAVRARGPTRDSSPLVRRSLLRDRNGRVNRLGAQAERRVQRHYQLRGCIVLDTNARAGGSELDLVVRRGRRARLLRGEGA